jgi:hypothetical protein
MLATICHTTQRHVPESSDLQIIRNTQTHCISVLKQVVHIVTTVLYRGNFHLPLIRLQLRYSSVAGCGQEDRGSIPGRDSDHSDTAVPIPSLGPERQSNH